MGHDAPGAYGVRTKIVRPGQLSVVRFKTGRDSQGRRLRSEPRRRRNSAGEVIETHEVSEAGASIGRSKDNEIQLDASSVSKRHASIVFARGSFWLADHTSRNGTVLNGERLVAAVPPGAACADLPTAPLAVGDSIVLGVVKLEVTRIDAGRGARLSLDVHPYAARLAGRTDVAQGLHSESACGADAESDASEPQAHASGRQNGTAEHEPQPFSFSYKDRAAARRQLQSAFRRCCTVRCGVPALVTCCTSLQHVMHLGALRCNALHCVATRDTALQHVALRWNPMHFVETRYNT